MTVITPTPTFTPTTWIPPLSLHLDRVTYSYGLAFRMARRGNVTEARELVWQADRLLRFTELTIDRLVNDDPVNDRGRLLEQADFIRSSRASLIDFA